MDNTTLKNITDSCKKEISVLSLTTGLDQLHIIARYCSNKQIISKIEELIENYNCMLTFLASGGKDEERENTQEIICKKALEILRSANRDIRLQCPNNKYASDYIELRNSYGEKTEEEILKRWGTNLNPDEQLLLQDQLFTLLWTAPLWEQKQTAQWYEFISRQTDFTKIHLTGAVIMSLWEYFDEEKMALLFLLSDTDCVKLNALSITALVLLAEKYQKELPIYPALLQQYQNSYINKHVATVYKEKLLITQTLQEIRKEQEEMSNFTLSMSNEDMEKLMKSKMSHLRYMMNKGLDVNLSNRTDLWYKCDFLREKVSHWWLPFEKSSPVVEELLLDKDGNFNKQTYKMLDLPSECDIDRYAMYSFMSKAQYKKSFIEQMAKSLDFIGFDDDPNLVPYVDNFKITMQNMYRIFDHSPIKKEIDNPFLWTNDFWKNRIFKSVFKDEKALELCGEMKDSQLYEQAIDWIDYISETSGTSLEMLKLKCSCLAHTDRYSENIASLTQMLFLDEDNEWALNLLQICYGKIDKVDQQLECLNKLLKIKPDELKYLDLTAEVLTNMKRYEEALKILFHLDYLMPNEPKYMSDLVACAIRLRKFDVAQRYNQSILEHPDINYKHQEYMNAGNIHFLQGDWKSALECYKQFHSEILRRNKKEGTETDPAKEFRRNAFLLIEMGIKIPDVQLMCDMMLT